MCSYVKFLSFTVFFPRGLKKVNDLFAETFLFTEVGWEREINDQSSGRAAVQYVIMQLHRMHDHPFRNAIVKPPLKLLAS